MSKLWTTFQTQYRVSTTYQASVVLLESTRATKSPLPVLMRGEGDRGVDVTPEFPPVLEGIEYRDLRNQESALTAGRLNEIVTIRGERLPTARVELLIRDPNRRTTPTRPDADIIARLAPLPGSNKKQIVVELDEARGNWVSGPLQAILEWRSNAGKLRRSVPLFLALAPVIHDDSGPTAVVTTPAGNRRITIRSNPPIARLPDQSLPDVTLLLSPMGAEKPPNPVPVLDRNRNASNSELAFDVRSVPPGDYRLRLRIDTVESIVMKRDGLRLEFDERQTVRL
jgi:hypothetical protein